MTYYCCNPFPAGECATASMVSERVSKPGMLILKDTCSVWGYTECWNSSRVSSDVTLVNGEKLCQ